MQALERLLSRNFQFTLPRDSQKFLDRYSKSSNSFLSFMRDHILVENGTRTSSQQLFQWYEEYVKKNRFDPVPSAHCRAILETLPGVTAKKMRFGLQSLHGYEGIKLVDSKETPPKDDCWASFSPQRLEDERFDTIITNCFGEKYHF